MWEKFIKWITSAFTAEVPFFVCELSFVSQPSSLVYLRFLCAIAILYKLNKRWNTWMWNSSRYQYKTTAEQENTDRKIMSFTCFLSISFCFFLSALLRIIVSVISVDGIFNVVKITSRMSTMEKKIHWTKWKQLPTDLLMLWSTQNNTEKIFKTRNILFYISIK